LGSAALALVRLEGGTEDEDPRMSMAGAMADALVAEVARIQDALDAGQGQAERPSRFPGELVALELFAGYQPLAICRYTRSTGRQRSSKPICGCSWPLRQRGTARWTWMPGWNVTGRS